MGEKDKSILDNLHGNCDYCKNKKYKGIANKPCVIPEPCLSPDKNNWVYDENSLDDMLYKELTEQEKLDMEKSANAAGFGDWNKLSLDDLSDYLEELHKFSSSGESFAIFKLIEFYKENK